MCPCSLNSSLVRHNFWQVTAFGMHSLATLTFVPESTTIPCGILLERWMTCGSCNCHVHQLQWPSLFLQRREVQLTWLWSMATHILAIVYECVYVLVLRIFYTVHISCSLSLPPGSITQSNNLIMSLSCKCLCDLNNSTNLHFVVIIVVTVVLGQNKPNTFTKLPLQLLRSYNYSYIIIVVILNVSNCNCNDNSHCHVHYGCIL